MRLVSCGVFAVKLGIACGMDRGAEPVYFFRNDPFLNSENTALSYKYNN